MNALHVLLHYPSSHGACHQLFDIIEKIDPNAPVKKNWKTVIEHLENAGMTSTEVVIDVFSGDGTLSLQRLRDLWKLRVNHNHSQTPIYVAVSCHEQPPALRYEIRRLGGRFIFLSDVTQHLASELQEISFQLNEVTQSFPRWEIVEETFGTASRRVYVFLLFGGKAISVRGSDTQRAVLAVMLKNNGIARSMKALRQLCGEDPLFIPSGGSLAVPQLGTMKMYLYRDYPKHLQRVFDEVRCGFHAQKVIEHIDLGAKAIGFKIRGRSTVTIR